MSVPYQPDSWVIVRLPEQNGKTYYKVLGGWSGGYLDGSSWRLNSGITRFEDNEDGTFSIFGESGSEYEVRSTAYRVTMAMAGAANRLTELGCKILDRDEAIVILKGFMS